MAAPSIQPTLAQDGEMPLTSTQLHLLRIYRTIGMTATGRTVVPISKNGVVQIVKYEALVKQSLLIDKATHWIYQSILTYQEGRVYRIQFSARIIPNDVSRRSEDSLAKKVPPSKTTPLSGLTQQKQDEIDDYMDAAIASYMSRGMPYTVPKESFQDRLISKFSGLYPNVLDINILELPLDPKEDIMAETAVVNLHLIKVKSENGEIEDRLIINPLSARKDTLKPGTSPSAAPASLLSPAAPSLSHATPAPDAGAPKKGSPAAPKKEG